MHYVIARTRYDARAQVGDFVDNPRTQVFTEPDQLRGVTFYEDDNVTWLHSSPEFWANYMMGRRGEKRPPAISVPSIPAVMQKPSIGRVVHYVSYGTPGGEFDSTCRAALITELDGKMPADANVYVGLCVLNPTGQFFNQHVPYDDSGKRGGTWHWPERT